MSEHKMLSRNEAATFLGIKPQTLAVWATTGRYKLPFVKVGRRVLYKLSDLELFIEKNIMNHTN